MNEDKIPYKVAWQIKHHAQSLADAALCYVCQKQKHEEYGFRMKDKGGPSWMFEEFVQEDLKSFENDIKRLLSVIPVRYLKELLEELKESAKDGNTKENS